jgi:hypothetical protein
VQITNAITKLWIDFPKITTNTGGGSALSVLGIGAQFYDSLPIAPDSTKTIEKNQGDL